ncbi:hypothetical protein [Phytoactinopolyspora halotolerans]|uniref:NifU family protein n=1 Tax=Phytoactinopolyspora halotolerans TaxID=1981512 RepID=A0A6L9S5S8_9ACTN|nr:hypothetical protein [Phytoactinopolyspora halotolerans]NEE00449.1 hypothetical protein [Phytoactinopolyspora halotolerans]
MTQNVDDSAAVDAALQQFRDMLANDGYLLTWSKSGEDQVVVQVEAGPDACADCLVPQPVMEAIMSEALEATPYRLDHVVLPAGEH